ncbi:hypothetical protein QFC21_003748 [Naganishia friedmannii]|uniref:Uncharacterized protein n=1 Tax=Naganishia friedmannii TaxID=89922 RepID=A0ACC2VLJ0_9TREE|nr:hypothetical protein QFC21_003748 [Naganishia friedmannii]
MAFLNNPAVNHFVHLTILGAFLFFSFVTLAVSAGFIAKGKHNYFGYYFDAAGLILAESIFCYIAAVVYIVFNTFGNLYQGRKNSIMVELAVFSVLFILSLFWLWFQGLPVRKLFVLIFTAAVKLTSGTPSFRLGKATLAFAWLSTLTLLVLLAFLTIWILIHRRRRGDGNIMMTSIKAHHVEGPFQGGGSTNMANLGPAATAA